MSANTPEPINNEQLLEVDYLVKQNLYGVIKSDGFTSSGNTTTTPGNEFYSYKQVIRSDSIWINSKDLVINGTNSVYANRRSLQCADMNASGIYGTNNPSLVGRAWATNISNWISPEFNITFTIIAYIGLISNASTFPNTLSNFSQIDTTAYPYIFNYGAGVLTFIGNIPPNLYPNTNKTYALFINGYIYTGDLGLFSSNTSIVTSNITSASITTQNNSINAGSGSIYTSNIYLTGNLYSSNGLLYSSGIGQNTNITSLTINTQNNTLNVGSGTIYGSLFATSITSGQITTQNNTLNVGSGTIYGSLFATSITSGQITTQNNVINVGSGSITANTAFLSNEYVYGTVFTSQIVITDTGIFTSTTSPTTPQNITAGTINTQNNTINTGSGIINIGGVTINNNNYTIAGLLSRSSVLTTQYSITISSLGQNSAGITLDSQIAAASCAWRINAYGSYQSSISNSSRQFSVSSSWGNTALSLLKTGDVLTTGQTTNWVCKIDIIGISTTAINMTGHLINGVTAGTSTSSNAVALLALTQTNNVPSGPQRIDFTVGQTGTNFAADIITVQSVFIERIL
jgi:hypothetical protein